MITKGLFVSMYRVKTKYITKELVCTNIELIVVYFSHKVYKVYVETKEQVRLLHMIDADSTTKVRKQK